MHSLLVAPETITGRIDATTRIPPRCLISAPPPPRSVKIEICPRFHARRGFRAPRAREAQPGWDMDFALFKRITREMRDAGVDQIGVFYLGESFMNPRLLVDCIAYLKDELGVPYVFLTSSAAVAFPEAVEACMKAGLDSLKWSVNAADERQFERIMGVTRELFRRALENIQAAWAIRESGGHRTRLYASSTRYDGLQREKMERLLAGHVRPWVDEHYWLPLYPMDVPATQPGGKTGHRIAAGSRGRIGALREPLPCWSAFTAGHVTADGRLSACCFDASAPWTMGDLNRQSFMEAWHSAPFIGLREAHLRRDVHGTACEQCVAYSS